MKKLNLGVLISGRGSNLKSIIEATEEESYPAEVKVVISNIIDAGGLNIAKDHNIPSVFISHKEYSSRELFEKEIDKVLKYYNIDLVCLAGFMRILSPWFTDSWPNKCINIHPSLLPAYKGVNTHRRAIEAKEPYAGCTVHYVTAELDSGAIILQTKVKIEPNETEETLGQKVLIEEHKIFPLAIKQIAGK